VEIFNCDKIRFQANVNIVLLNPDGENLGFGYIPYPTVFIIMLVIWGLGFLIWTYNWIKYRSLSSKFNKMITLFPLVKIAYSAVSIYYWKTDSMQGEVSDSMEYLFIFWIILEEAVFYIVLMLISIGWGFTQRQFDPDKFVIAGVIVGLIVTRILGYMVHNLFFLLSFLIYIVVIVVIFRFINNNLRDLHNELRDNPRPITTDPSLPNPIAEKEKMMKAFKATMMGYLAAVMMIMLFQLLFLRDYPWITDTLRELSELMIFICIGWTFRLKNPDVYYQLDEDDTFFRGESIENRNESSQQSMPSQN